MDVAVEEPFLYSDEVLQPPVPCPQCGQPVRGFLNASSNDASDPFKRILSSATVSLPSSLGSRFTQRMLWTLAPCHCRVDQYWMSGMAAEMARRGKGEPARTVEGNMPERDRASLISLVSHQVAAKLKLREAADLAGQPSRSEQLSKEIVIWTAELIRYVPEGRNLLQPIEVPAAVRAWASGKGLAIPRQPSIVTPTDLPVPSLSVDSLMSFIRHEVSTAGWSDAALRGEAERLLLQLVTFWGGGPQPPAATIALVRRMYPNLTMSRVAPALEPADAVTFVGEVSPPSRRKIERGIAKEA